MPSALLSFIHIRTKSRWTSDVKRVARKTGTWTMTFNGFWWVLGFMLRAKKPFKSCKNDVKNKNFLEGFWTPFRTLQGVVWDSQNPLNSIIPEVRFSSLFPTPLREAFRRRPRRDFGCFLGGFGIDFGRFLVSFLEVFDIFFLQLFERARPRQNFFKLIFSGSMKPSTARN